MNTLKDKVILITGAGRGRGRALAQAFAGRGAFVAANDISPINLDSLVANGDEKSKHTWKMWQKKWVCNELSIKWRMTLDELMY